MARGIKRIEKEVEAQRARVARIECEQGHLGNDDLFKEWEKLAELEALLGTDEDDTNE